MFNLRYTGYRSEAELSKASGSYPGAAGSYQPSPLSLHNYGTRRYTNFVYQIILNFLNHLNFKWKLAVVKHEAW